MNLRPQLIDLFCGAGGAAVGYHRAGFEVTGVDLHPQPRYPFRFIQGDALTVDLAGYDAIHASPPCQAHSSLKGMWNARAHVDLIPATRARLIASGLPYVMENVPGAPLAGIIILCGTMFDLGTEDAELRRHRLFECPTLMLAPSCRHGRKPRVIGVYGGHGRDRRRLTNTQDFSMAERRHAMGIDWMTGRELSQAIPPAYTEWIGRRLLDTVSIKEVPA